MRKAASAAGRPPGAFLARWCVGISIAILLALAYWTFLRSSNDYDDRDVWWSKDARRIDDRRGSDGGSSEKRNGPRVESIRNSKQKPVASSSQDNRRIVPFAESHCPPWNDDMLNVHFVLHSHDDPGWLKTAEQYYKEDVFYILNGVLEQLVADPHRKFLYSEMYFFSKWWKGLDENKRQVVRRLVQNGQLEFVGGGWVQNDDASTHYTASIDQLTYGWSKIDDYFGSNALPVTGWHVDNFGYSQEQASIFQQMGLDEDVIVRLHHLDIEKRRKMKKMEFLWQTSPGAELFTHVLFDHYTSPQGFHFESSYYYDKITDVNEYEKTLELLDIVRTRSQSYQTNHLMFIFGNDFVFKNAKEQFKPLDRLIHHGNMLQLSNGSNVQMFYSTPSCYFKAVRDRQQRNMIKWPRYDGDFYPYATGPVNYWTGYFSSRSAMKRNIRVANNMLVTAQNLAAPVITSTIEAYLNASRESLYTTLHHDGITGTCQQKVADDYLRLALESVARSQHVINAVLPSLTGTDFEHLFEFCPLANISVCPHSSGREEVTLVIVNGFSHKRTSFVRIPVDDGTRYKVTDTKTGYVITSQIFPVTDEDKQFGTVNGRSNKELGFFASLPALGFATFKVKKTRSEAVANNYDSNNRVRATSIENQFFKLQFDNAGKLASLIDKKNDNRKMRLVQDFFWYSNPQSGAYMLRPERLNSVTEEKDARITRVEVGPLVQEVRQVFANWVTQIIRLYKDKPLVEFEWTVGPLKPENLGKEVITRFSTGMRTGRTFYTDANGRRFMKRKRDPMDSMYPLASSFYPVTTATAIQDATSQLTLITDRSLAASSTENGSLELIVYRKVLHDDGAGMGEGLDERDNSTGRGIVVRGKIWLAMAPLDQADAQWRNLAKEMFYEPILAFSPSPLQGSWPNTMSLLRKVLPPPIHLLSLQRLSKTSSCLVRFEHFHSAEDDAAINFQFQDLFRRLTLQKCEKTQLGGWNKNAISTSLVDGFTASLRPMDIVTFKCVCIET